MDDGNVLLVEGIQDAHVFKHLCDYHGIQSQIVNQRNLVAQGISTKNDVGVVGIWLMPNNSDRGMLEDFVSSLIPPGDALWEQAKSYVDDIPEQDRRFPPEHRVKAYLHAWLAVQREPGQPFGYAIAKGYLDRDTWPATQLVAWLRRLFALA